MNNQLTVPDLVLQNEQFFINALSSDQVQWKKESQFAIQSLSSNDYLCKAAFANPASMQNAIINIAAIGISLNPALKHAYLVPRSLGKNKPVAVCLDISYQGLMHIAMSSGAIEWGQAKLVYRNDEYINNGIDKAPTHKQNTFGDKGDVIGVYCTVKTSSGDYLTEEMDLAAIEKVRASSKASTGPWSTWWDEMARKTVVKRAYKYWPKCEHVGEAIEVLNEHEGFDEIKEVKRTAKIAFEENYDSIIAIREAFKEERYADMVMYWDEISGDPEADTNSGNNDKTLLWVAPTKYQQYGLDEPVFSTEIRKFLKENASQYR